MYATLEVPHRQRNDCIDKDDITIRLVGDDRITHVLNQLSLGRLGCKDSIYIFIHRIARDHDLNVLSHPSACSEGQRLI